MKSRARQQPATTPAPGRTAVAYVRVSSKEQEQGFSIPAQRQLLTEYAKDFCNRCPVRAECEDYAVTNEIEFGIFGGKTEDERADDRDAKRAPGVPVKRRPNPPTTHARCGTYSGCSRHRRLNEAYCDACKDAKAAYERDRKARMRANREVLSA